MEEVAEIKRNESWTKHTNKHFLTRVKMILQEEERIFNKLNNLGVDEWVYVREDEVGLYDDVISERKLPFSKEQKRSLNRPWGYRRLN